MAVQLAWISTHQNLLQWRFAPCAEFFPGTLSMYATGHFWFLPASGTRGCITPFGAPSKYRHWNLWQFKADGPMVADHLLCAQRHLVRNILLPTSMYSITVINFHPFNVCSFRIEIPEELGAPFLAARGNLCSFCNNNSTAETSLFVMLFGHQGP